MQRVIVIRVEKDDDQMVTRLRECFNLLTEFYPELRDKESEDNLVLKAYHKVFDNREFTLGDWGMLRTYALTRAGNALRKYSQSPFTSLPWATAVRQNVNRMKETIVDWNKLIDLPN